MTDAGETMLTEIARLRKLSDAAQGAYFTVPPDPIGNYITEALRLIMPMADKIEAQSATIKRLETERDDAVREVERWKHRPIIRREDPRPFVIDED